MATRKKRRPGQPRKVNNRFGRWIDGAGRQRVLVAEKLGISHAHLNRLCRNERRPDLELALKIEKMTKGEVAVSFWATVPKTPRT